MARNINMRHTWKKVFTILSGVSFLICLALTLPLANLCDFGHPDHGVFIYVQAISFIWSSPNPSRNVRSPRPSTAATQDLDASAMDTIRTVFQGMIPSEAWWASSSEPEMVVDSPIFQLQRSDPDPNRASGDEADQLLYRASVPLSGPVLAFLVLPVCWCIWRFRSSSYSRRVNKTPNNRLGRRLIVFGGSLFIATFVVIVWLQSVAHRQYLPPYMPSAGWCTSEGTITGIQMPFGAVMFEWDYHVNNGGTIVSKHRLDFLGFSFFYLRRISSSWLMIWLPLWIPPLAVIVLVIAAFLPVPREYRRLRRIQRGLCHSCGYDLRGIDSKCPECGTARSSMISLPN